MNLDDFNQIFNILISIYPNTKNVEEVSTAYFLALGSELTKDEFLNATTKILKKLNIQKNKIILKKTLQDDINKKK